MKHFAKLGHYCEKYYLIVSCFCNLMMRCRAYMGGMPCDLLMPNSDTL